MDITPDMIRGVRLYTADTDPNHQCFADTDLVDFLELNGGNIKLAAADVLDAIAVSEALIGKVIRTQDLQTDGTKVAAQLQARARQLREQADADTSVDIFDVVYPPTGHTRPEGAEHTVVWGL